MNVSAQDRSLRAGELQHCIFHSPSLRPFSPDSRISTLRGRGPQRQGAPWETLSGPCPPPRRGHTSISPRSTRLAALPSKKHVGFASRINRRGSPLVPLCSPSHARVPTCSPAPINGSSRRFSPPLPAAGVRGAGCECTAGGGFAGAFRLKCSRSPGAGCS